MRAEEEAQKQEEEWCAREEEEWLAVEQDLHEEGGPSWERAPRRRLFLPSSSDSAGSLEEEEGMEVRVEGPSWDKGKGQAPVSKEAREEVTGVICDLCDKKGIPCRWGKVSTSSGYYFCLLTFPYRRQPAFRPAWPANKPGQNATSEVRGPPRGNG